MKTPVTQHIHCAMIIAWAKGESIQRRTFCAGAEWRDITTPTWDCEYEYRVKPEDEYPKTSLTPENLYDEFTDDSLDTVGQDLERVVNAALEHFVTSGNMDAYLKTRNSNN